LNSQHFPQVEDSLLPVRVFCVWAGGEADRLVASSEIDVEPSDERMDEVIAAAVKSERGCEGQVGGCTGVEVEG
jgi:hypothetical protein